jgi:hypothetical protein
MLTSSEQAAVYKFRIGQKVDVVSPALDRFASNGPFVVTEQFLHRGAPFYCVKSPHEPYERVLAENRLCALTVARWGRAGAPVQSA